MRAYFSYKNNYNLNNTEKYKGEKRTRAERFAVGYVGINDINY